MKRVLLILALAIVACIAACAIVYFYQMRIPSDEWMGRRLGLSGEALAEFTAAHYRYAATCAEMCRKIQNADARLAALVLENTGFNAEIVEAMTSADALRTECRQNMLRHFYEVAAMLGPRERETYMDLVLPLIVHPELMSQGYQHP